MSDETNETEIEVGAFGPDFRLWIARESLRQSEQLLAAQLSSVQSMEGRANSILSWSVAAALGLAATAKSAPWSSFVLAELCLCVSAALCIVASWPSAWHYPGYEKAVIEDMEGKTEVEKIEAVVGGYQQNISFNERRLKSFGTFLKIAWVSFAFAALVQVVLPIASLVAARQRLF